MPKKATPKPKKPRQKILASRQPRQQNRPRNYVWKSPHFQEIVDCLESGWSTDMVYKWLTYRYTGEIPSASSINSMRTEVKNQVYFSEAERKERYREKWWLTNGKVAWEIPPGRIATWYADAVYLPPDGWRVISFPPIGEGWRDSKFGCRVKVGS